MSDKANVPHPDGRDARVWNGVIRPSRRALVLGSGAAAIDAFASGAEESSARRVQDGLIWGVNGHPFSAYPGVPYEAQLDLVRETGFTQYRVNLGDTNLFDAFDELLTLAERRHIGILPIIMPGADFEGESASHLHDVGFEQARAWARQFRGRIRVWELGNEFEIYAILRPCEMRDDGTQYPCEWGRAGGVGSDEYFGPRWAKVSAALSGLSRGLHEGDRRARGAMGTAGWGHLGAFERMKADGINWDITVWHDYPGVSEEYLGILHGYGKPIWITEFNSGNVDQSDEANGRDLMQRVAYYRNMRTRYRIEAAFIYELLDEPYWGDTYEARMGLYRLDRDGENWRIGARKANGEAMRQALLR